MRHKNERLHELLYKNRVALISKAFENLLSSVESVTFHEFVSDSDERVNSLWSTAVSYDAAPSSKIARTVSKGELAQWIRGCLTVANIKDVCYIFVSDFGELPWAKVRVDSEADWLFSFWEQFTSLDMMIMNSDQTDVVIFIEEEYWFEAHISRLAHLSAF
jgi:hypothetical protein